MPRKRQLKAPGVALTEVVLVVLVVLAVAVVAAAAAAAAVGVYGRGRGSGGCRQRAFWAGPCHHHTPSPSTTPWTCYSRLVRWMPGKG